MLTLQSRQKGATLIELMIGVALMSILLYIAMPSFSLWMQNTQNRGAAESILDGLQLARSEAVRYNTSVRFSPTNATGLAAWTVGCVIVTAECPATIQSKTAAEGTVNARVGTDASVPPTPLTAGFYATALTAGAGLPNGVTFDGMGRVPTANIGADIARIDITNAVVAGARRYVITIGSGGIIRMCDPALALANNPQGCQ
ncbi:hypothetical protein SCT_3216 [Sulfuricella sp. T08]|uniref:GspH/FimT family pseudopilin n=1 Tax=Sulfuricella sp. T08 TaxID=1632857 RepID=UPI0006179F5F|nr:GspH/FimT family pseudopilin [Sulfuricella sp. T08]GAO37778.1 hypothetical protein SCT_3216 [Sulfuricella sp. T08]